MFSFLKRRSATLTRRSRKLGVGLHLENLEGRTMMSATPINFTPTVLSPPVVMNGDLYFAGSDPTHGKQLWESDGTAAGTVMLTDDNVSNGGLNPQNLTAVGNSLFFSGGDSNGIQLW